TARDVRIGTPSYMSPEQIRGVELDGRSDLFSLGVSLYEMIVGCVPFQADNPHDLNESILKDEPPPISVDPVNASRVLECVVSTALRKNRNDRYQTATELITDLQKVKRELETPIPASLFGHQRASPNLISRLAKRISTMIGIVTVVSMGRWL